jgi:hypothetical protein
MPTTPELIARPAQRILGLAANLVDDIPADHFARLPKIGDTRASINHPAFVLGHLALYPGRVLELCGIDASDLACPASYDEVFAAGKECRDDPEGTIYPARDEIIATFTDRHTRGLERLHTLTDADLERDIAIDRYREIFGTAGVGVNFIMNTHLGFHLGQLSAWRRAMGYGSAM